MHPLTPAMAPLAPTIGTTEGRVADDLSEGGGQPAGQIKNDEPAVPHTVLDVVSEDPEVEHVGEKV